MSILSNIKMAAREVADAFNEAPLAPKHTPKHTFTIMYPGATEEQARREASLLLDRTVYEMKQVKGCDGTPVWQATIN